MSKINQKMSFNKFSFQQFQKLFDCQSTIVQNIFEDFRMQYLK